MTKRAVTIVDYNVGNLRSMGRAIKEAGGEPVFDSTPEGVAAADVIVLPGVGAFGSCISALQERGLDDAVREVVAKGRPLLGVCVGMQMLLDESTEFGRTPGFGFIPGIVDRIPGVGADGKPHKVPHIGWSELKETGAGWAGTPLDTIEPHSSCYFVHSFAARPVDPSHVIATCDYDGQEICAAVRRDSIVGMQFHPEKSGPTGLKILARFIETAYGDRE